MDPVFSQLFGECFFLLSLLFLSHGTELQVLHAHDLFSGFVCVCVLFFFRSQHQQHHHVGSFILSCTAAASPSDIRASSLTSPAFFSFFFPGSVPTFTSVHTFPTFISSTQPDTRMVMVSRDTGARTCSSRYCASILYFISMFPQQADR